MDSLLLILVTSIKSLTIMVNKSETRLLSISQKIKKLQFLFMKIKDMDLKMEIL